MSERIEKIRDAIQVIHRCAATHTGSAAVTELFGDKVVWEGVVEIFDITGHPKATRCYGWSFPHEGETQFVTVLEIPPVDSPQTAVRAAIRAQLKSGAPR